MRVVLLRFWSVRRERIEPSGRHWYDSFLVG